MRLWLLCEDWTTSEIRFHPRNAGRVLNGMEVTQAISDFTATLPGDAPWPDPYPPSVPMPRVSFARRRLPDYNITQNLPFVSDRLREAMALPEDVAQFLPISNLSRTDEARAAAYLLLHVRAAAPAIDGARSDCDVEHYTSAKTGADCKRYAGLAGIRFVAPFTPPADLFRDAVELTILLATDALAQRVIEAGCTGVQFRHPLWFAPGFDQVVKMRDGAARIVWDEDGRDYTLSSMPLEEADLGPPGDM